MDEQFVRRFWSLFLDTLAELEETDSNAAKSIMNDVSTFATDWWGDHS